MSVGRSVTLAETIKEYLPKVKAVFNKAMGQYNTPEARERVIQNVKKGAEFGLCPYFSVGVLIVLLY